MPTRRFQPLRAKDSQADQAYSEISQVIDALAPLEQYPLRTDARVNPAAGTFMRIAPRAVGMDVVLPSPGPSNFGQTITLFAMNSLGTIRIRATTGTVNGASAITFGSGITALIVLTSDGESRWATASALGSLHEMTASRILGRAEGAGTGPVQQLTGAQVGAILDSVTFVWTGSHTFNGVFIVDSANDVTVATQGGLWLGAGHTPVITPGVANGDVIVNATSGVDITAHSTTPGTGAGGGEIALRAETVFRVQVGGSERLEIQADGAWEVEGDEGTDEEALVSQGTTLPPVWKVPRCGVAGNTSIPNQTNVANTTLTGATFTIPANTLVAGSTYELVAFGAATRGATATAASLRGLVVAAGSTEAAAGIAVPTGAGVYGFMFRGTFTQLTTGGAGTAVCQGCIALNSGSVSVFSDVATFVNDTTTSTALIVGTNFSAAVANLRCDIASAYIVRIR